MLSITTLSEFLLSFEMKLAAPNTRWTQVLSLGTSFGVGLYPEVWLSPSGKLIVSMGSAEHAFLKVELPQTGTLSCVDSDGCPFPYIVTISMRETGAEFPPNGGYGDGGEMWATHTMDVSYQIFKSSGSGSVALSTSRHFTLNSIQTVHGCLPQRTCSNAQLRRVRYGPLPSPPPPPPPHAHTPHMHSPHTHTPHSHSPRRPPWFYYYYGYGGRGGRGRRLEAEDDSDDQRAKYDGYEYDAQDDTTATPVLASSPKPPPPSDGETALPRLSRRLNALQQCLDACGDCGPLCAPSPPPPSPLPSPPPPPPFDATGDVWFTPSPGRALFSITTLSESLLSFEVKPTTTSTQWTQLLALGGSSGGYRTEAWLTPSGHLRVWLAYPGQSPSSLTTASYKVDSQGSLQISVSHVVQVATRVTGMEPPPSFCSESGYGDMAICTQDTPKHAMYLSLNGQSMGSVDLSTMISWSGNLDSSTLVHGCVSGQTCSVALLRRVRYGALPSPPPPPRPPPPSPSPSPPPHAHTPHGHSPHVHSPHGHWPSSDYYYGYGRGGRGRRLEAEGDSDAKGSGGYAYDAQDDTAAMPHNTDTDAPSPPAAVGGSRSNGFGASASEKTESTESDQMLTHSVAWKELAPLLRRLDLGLSAKFDSTGKVRETNRWHAYIHQVLRAEPPFNERMSLLSQSMVALSAPPLALAWVEALKSNFSVTAPTIMLGASPDVAKLYVQADQGAARIPNLPVSHDEWLFDRLPSTRAASPTDIISLEWQPREKPSTRVVLRYYAMEPQLSFEQLVRKWAAEKTELAAAVLHAMAAHVRGAQLVWRSTPYRPEAERVPTLRPTKLGIFLKSSGVDVVKPLLADPRHVNAWAKEASDALVARSSGAEEPMAGVSTASRTI